MPLVMRTIAFEIRRADHGLVPAHFRLMRMLDRHACSLSELAGRQAVRLPTASKSISTLVGRGWVARLPAGDDRRQVRVALTPAGQAALHRMNRVVEAHLAGLLVPATGEEVERLTDGLGVLRQALESHAPEKATVRPMPTSRHRPTR
jgi:DNA-binding MarR family transcriptional regulator